MVFQKCAHKYQKETKLSILINLWFVKCSSTLLLIKYPSSSSSIPHRSIICWPLTLTLINSTLLSSGVSLRNRSRKFSSSGSISVASWKGDIQKNLLSLFLLLFCNVCFICTGVGCWQNASKADLVPLGSADVRQPRCHTQAWTSLSASWFCPQLSPPSENSMDISLQLMSFGHFWVLFTYYFLTSGSYSEVFEAFKCDSWTRKIQTVVQNLVWPTGNDSLIVNRSHTSLTFIPSLCNVCLKKASSSRASM